MDNVLRLLKSYGEVDAGLQEYLYDALKPIDYAKGEFLVKKGTVPRYLGFIEKGLIRGYRIDHKGHEFTSWLMKEGDIYAAVRAFFNQRRATEWVEAIEPTSTLCLTFEQLQYALEKWPSFEKHQTPPPPPTPAPNRCPSSPP